MKTKFAERGQALILITLAAIGLFAIVALAIDGGAKFSDRRHAQNAADTASLAGAVTKADGLTAGQTDSVCSTATGYANSPFCLDIINAAWNIAGTNGYIAGSLPNKVDVYSPPISGAYVGKSSYVQVVITSYVNTFFARVIGIRQTKNVVDAVALAGKGGNFAKGASVIAINPNPNCGSGVGSGGGSFDVGGNGTINLTGGGLFVNATTSCAYSQTSCTVALNIGGGAGIYSAGSTDNINQACGTPATEQTGQAQIAIPEDVVYPNPNPPAECSMTAHVPTNNPIGSDNWTIYPGYYTDFPQAGLIAQNKDITLSPGVYCVDADVHWSGSTFNNLDGTSGVTIYITEGHSFDLNINSPINLEPSNSGNYQGYLFIVGGNQNSHPSCTINGGSYLTMNGIIFAPYCNVTINGNNTTDSTINAQIIGWDVKLNGKNTININYDPNQIVKIKRRVGLMH